MQSVSALCYSRVFGTVVLQSVTAACALNNIVPSVRAAGAWNSCYAVCYSSVFGTVVVQSVTAVCLEQLLCSLLHQRVLYGAVVG